MICLFTFEGAEVNCRHPVPDPAGADENGGLLAGLCRKHKRRTGSRLQYLADIRHPHRLPFASCWARDVLKYKSQDRMCSLNSPSSYNVRHPGSTIGSGDCNLLPMYFQFTILQSCNSLHILECDHEEINWIRLSTVLKDGLRADAQTHSVHGISIVTAVDGNIPVLCIFIL